MEYAKSLRLQSNWDRRAEPLKTAKLKFDFVKLIARGDPRDVPAYTIPEAAHYLQIPRATLRSWAMGRHYPTSAGKRFFKPVIDLPDKSDALLSFCNLVEAHILNALRRDYNVRLDQIRSALNYVTARWPSPHPLLDDRFQTDGKSLFIREIGKLVDASASGQVVMEQVIDAHFRRIERDSKRSVTRLYPFTRHRQLDEPKWVVIDPSISYGRPVLAGTCIATAVIAERYKAGESIDDLAQDYARPNLEIEEAVRCELTLEAA